MRALLPILLMTVGGLPGCTTLDEPTVPFGRDTRQTRPDTQATPSPPQPTQPPDVVTSGFDAAPGETTVPPEPPQGCFVVHRNVGPTNEGYEALIEITYRGPPLPKGPHNEFIITLEFAVPVALGIWQTTGFILGHIGYQGNKVTVPMQAPGTLGEFGTDFTSFEFGANVNTSPSNGLVSVQLGDTWCALTHL